VKSLKLCFSILIDARVSYSIWGIVALINLRDQLLPCAIQLRTRCVYALMHSHRPITALFRNGRPSVGERPDEVDEKETRTELEAWTGCACGTARMSNGEKSTP
jgi:hypothetical protein